MITKNRLIKSIYFLGSFCVALVIQNKHSQPIKNSARWEERADFAKYFEKNKIKGCFLLYDLKNNKYIGYNLSRAQKIAFLPASTFKIFNSLIALEAKAIKNENEIIKWDGVDRGLPEWNQDLTMRMAIKYSAVWFYQEMARRIGQNRMQKYINLARYGNMNIDGKIDSFWLDGKLRITAKQQINFLVDLYQNKLPFSSKTINIVKDILINEKTDQYILRAKTGWAQRINPQIGWWVGYIEQNNNAYFFAINIDIINPKDIDARTDIAKNILLQLGLIAKND